MSDFTLADVETGVYADLMPDMSEADFEGLRTSIRENGFDENSPVLVTEDGIVVDGHHRIKACRDLNVEPEFSIVTDPTIEQAIRTNLSRRNLTGGEKEAVVRQYLDEYHDGDETQSEIAERLGVGQSTVSRAWAEVYDDYSREEKREIVADYLDRNPDASNREVARNIEADVSHATIGNWREEWEAAPENEGTETASEDTTEATGAGESDAIEDDEDEHDIDGAPDQDDPQEAVAAEPTPNAVPNGGDDAGDPFRTAASEATSRSVQHVDELESEIEDLRDANDRLQQRADRQAARADELESLVREFVRAVENQDVEKMQATADRATEVL